MKSEKNKNGEFLDECVVPADTNVIIEIESLIECI